MTTITPKLVQDFWSFMSVKYGTTATSKANAEEMKLVGQLLGSLGVTDKDAFLSQFTTTIGKTIYIPFTIGEVNEHWSLESQLGVCMHEHQHVIQALEAGEAMFFARYLLDPTWRATYEGAAYRANMTLSFQLFGVQPNTQWCMQSIANYGLGAAELAFFQQFLQMSIPVILAGGVPDESTRVTLDWLRSYPTE